jgi:hypothetical protein
MEKLGPRVRVHAVELIEGFKVRLAFDNGVQREIDLEPYLRGPIFEAVRNNTNLFRAVRVAGGTIVWDNGADIDPDVLYYNLTPSWAELPESVRS